MAVFLTVFQSAGGWNAEIRALSDLSFWPRPLRAEASCSGGRIWEGSLRRYSVLPTATGAAGGLWKKPEQSEWRRSGGLQLLAKPR